MHRKIADEFSEKLAAAMQATKYGDPLVDTDLDMGPLINEKGLQKVEQLVEGALAQGATALIGAKHADRPVGWHYEPTVLVDCRHEMDIVQQEIFGPVLPIVPFDDLDEAIGYANDSQFGLTSSIYTSNLNVAMRSSRELNFGETYINRENSKPCRVFMPFGANRDLVGQMANMDYMNTRKPTLSTCSTI